MTNAPEVESPEIQTPALPTQEVEALLSNMAKALRAFNMYRENNPVFRRFRELLHTSFARVWEQTDALELGVAEEGFRYHGHLIPLGKGRDSISFTFYKDGVRTLKFFPGFEDEVGTFLDAVNRAMRREDDADDLITVLWEEDFASLQYGYVDLLMEGLEVPDTPKEESPAGLDTAVLSLDLSLDVGGAEAAAEGEEAPAAGSRTGLLSGLSRDDFEDTVYFLDQGEMAALQTEVELEMERDLRGDVLKALFDRLEESTRPERQGEILDILQQLLPLFLSRGHLRDASTILQELDALVADGSPVGEALAERVEKLFARLSDPRVLEQFVQALEDGAVSPESEHVSLFFSRLRASAMPVLIRFAELSEDPAVKQRLDSAIDGLAARYPAEVNALLGSGDASVVTGAARVAGRVGLAQAVPGLAAALRHPDRDVRLAVVNALVAIRLTPALHALTLALDDDDREVRIAAARALGAVRFASARDALAAVIEGRRLRDADLTEKMAFFEAFGSLGGNAAVDRLASILNDKGFLGRRGPTELRACAALGLGCAGTPAARDALERARGEEDPIVKNAVTRALRQEKSDG